MIFFDQGIKWAFVDFEVRVVNSGVAFGFGQGWSGLWPWLTAGLLALLLVKYKYNWQTCLIAGGGLANLIDRMRWGGVIDYAIIGFLPRFNLADCFILAGLLGLMYSQVNGSKNNL